MISNWSAFAQIGGYRASGDALRCVPECRPAGTSALLVCASG
jgi:hypothetical protein